ncbi:bifunctional riboflavin kinase/FAD synthetase [Candidatus Liberibacter sp.]|uniref:bifunctional riboflavin kinase/FAD synthetase n=1 Tax=Candidatus Liberibacter sp. TaxID=34022 RepID=UPI0015F6941C|nr:bifunctional riboflavin kinase/FAD synthetase [Candidatus Liberibacter sp.]MBA5724186.1 bifunctional riboflavin kinase/FAD synthetase [Candidatus Liberibacter sp.]
MDVFHHTNINKPLPENLKGGVVAIGNFDGIHRGHCSVLENALKIANGSPTIVLTFEPHPRTILKAATPIFPIIPESIKIKVLENMGFSALIGYKFDLNVANYSAEKFIQKVLVEWLQTKTVVTGARFCFGKNRAGNGALLKKRGIQYGFNTVLVDEIQDNASEIISSTRIRTALKNGLVNEAAHLLGYHFTVESKVVCGEKLGRKLGYPTANMKLMPTISLKEGVYTVRFRTQKKISYCGVANFGRSPTINQNGSLFLESFIFDFSQEIYGQICTVSFFDFLRSEIKFQDIRTLIEYIQKDERKARALLSNSPPLSRIDRLICF